MKQLLPILFLLFVCTLCLNKNAAAQDTAATKANTDTSEEIVIVCSFPPMDAEFQGGEKAWQRFLSRHLVYPKKAKKKKIEGVVTVGIVIGKDGCVADVKVFSGPEELRQSAVAVVKKSPKWLSRLERRSQVAPPTRCNVVFKLDKE